MESKAIFLKGLRKLKTSIWNDSVSKKRHKIITVSNKKRNVITGIKMVIRKYQEHTFNNGDQVGQFLESLKTLNSPTK